MTLATIKTHIVSVSIRIMIFSPIDDASQLFRSQHFFAKRLERCLGNSLLYGATSMKTLLILEMFSVVNRVWCDLQDLTALTDGIYKVGTHHAFNSQFRSFF